jgi:hypothetical protein
MVGKFKIFFRAENGRMTAKGGEFKAIRRLAMDVKNGR